MKSQIELIENLQYFVFNFLSFYEQSFSKVLKNPKKIKATKVARLIDPPKSVYYFLFISVKEYYNRSLFNPSCQK